MTFDYGRAAATTALALAACSGLAACNDGSGSAASASAAATAARSASGSATSSASPTPTGSQAVTASISPTAVASKSPAPTAKAMAGAARPTATPSAAAVPAACKNLAVQADVKSAVTQTWEHAKRVSHIQPKPGNFYYGSCGTTLYAAVRFEAGADATGDDRVQLQDEGSGLQSFRFTPSTGWRFVGSDRYPATDDCSRFAPVDLARQWHCS
ncbi:hypothetical protein ACWELV_32265 [Streptomyces mirabilis]